MRKSDVVRIITRQPRGRLNKIFLETIKNTLNLTELDDPINFSFEIKKNTLIKEMLQDHIVDQYSLMT